MKTKHQLLVYFLQSKLKVSQGSSIRESWLDLHFLSNVNNDAKSFIYAHSCYLKTTLSYIHEQYIFLKLKDKQIKIDHILRSHFNAELLPVSFLHSFIETLQVEDLVQVIKICNDIENYSIQDMLRSPALEQKDFLIKTMTLVAHFFKFEQEFIVDCKINNKPSDLSLYRTYDSLDQLFRLNYQFDVGMASTPQNKERLYEGAGVGVQSGYSNFFTALDLLNPKQGAHIVDLGSGYGRLGFVVGLMRPDMDFIGYEYVLHRVENAQKSADHLSLGQQVHFYQQDLSLRDFKIPPADIYYLYDPFEAETYKYIIEQIKEISLKQKIFVVTKGHAKHWILDLATQEQWMGYKEFDLGNVCLFESPSRGIA